MLPFRDNGERRRKITARKLGAPLSGIDLNRANRRKRHRRNIVEAA
ncbi:MAG: hypothetical protein M3Y07_14630 [Acidobacteriota bacterium]|nr:hypothetical protein [Acidobacteriota bacterium]